MEDKVFSYWLGWMYSDGCIYSKISNYKYRYDIITFKSIDYEVVEAFARYLDLDLSKIRQCPNDKGNLVYHFQSGNKEMIKKFQEYGVCYRKTYEKLRLPIQQGINIDAFMLGYLEGNGSIKDRVFITGPASLLEDMKSYYSDFKIGLVYNKNSTRFEILGGLKERIRFLDILYNTNCHTMIRKYESYSQSRAKLEEKSRK